MTNAYCVFCSFPFLSHSEDRYLKKTKEVKKWGRWRSLGPESYYYLCYNGEEKGSRTLKSRMDKEAVLRRGLIGKNDKTENDIFIHTF